MLTRFLARWRADRAAIDHLLDHYFDPPTPAEVKQADRWRAWHEWVAAWWSAMEFYEDEKR